MFVEMFVEKTINYGKASFNSLEFKIKSRRKIPDFYCSNRKERSTLH